MSDLRLAAQRVRDLRLSSLELTFVSAKRVFDISSFSGPCHAADGLAHVRYRSGIGEKQKSSCDDTSKHRDTRRTWECRVRRKGYR